MPIFLLAQRGDITLATSAETLSEWDSLKHLQLMLMLEEEFHVQVSPETMEQLTSVERIAAWLEEQDVITGTRT